MAGSLTDVTDADFSQVVESSDTPVLVDFWAEWCGPCRAMQPVLEQLASDHDGKLRVVKLNIDENPQTAQRFRIMSIPTMLVFANGAVAKQLVGAMPKQRLESELSDWVSTTA